MPKSAEQENITNIYIFGNMMELKDALPKVGPNKAAVGKLVLGASRVEESTTTIQGSCVMSFIKYSSEKNMSSSETECSGEAPVLDGCDI